MRTNLQHKGVGADFLSRVLEIFVGVPEVPNMILDVDGRVASREEETSQRV